MLQLDWLRFSLSIQQLFSVAVSLTGRRSCSCKTKTRISHSHFRHFFVFLSSHWLIMISCCHLIGCCDYMTLNRKALLELTYLGNLQHYNKNFEHRQRPAKMDRVITIMKWKLEKRRALKTDCTPLITSFPYHH